MGWISPTSSNDPDANFQNEEDAYDENQATYANEANEPGSDSYGSFLELIPDDPIQCNAVRFDVLVADDITEIDVDIYTTEEAGWINVFEGVVTDHTFVTKTFVTQTVEKMRIRAYYDGEVNATKARIYEADFFEVENAVPKLVNGGLVNGGLIMNGGLV